MYILVLSFTSRIRDQSAGSLERCGRVLPWMVMACMPQSCIRSAISTMFLF
jgi:hypothetical protein